MPKKVLLIDYEPRSVDRMRSLLDGPEYVLTVAKDGEEGLSVFSAGSFDLVLLAGMLPRLPSAEVIREIRRKGGATVPPILLMVSGYHGTNPKADAQRVGAFDIIPRPFSDLEFRNALRNAIDSTDLGARTMRIPTLAIQAESESLTSEQIFSDVLDDVTWEREDRPARHVPSAPLPTAAPAPPVPTHPPAPAPAPPAAKPPEDDMERRLRDTLSGIMGKSPGPRPPVGNTPPAGTRFSTDADIDRMISDTLSGLKTPAKPKARPSGATAALRTISTLTPTGVTPPSGIRPRDREPELALVEERPPAPARSAPSAAPPPSFSQTPASLSRTPGSRPMEPRPIEPRPTEPAPFPQASSPDRFGQYEVLERIAAGGMAELSKARLSGVQGFEKIVAIKKILPHLADNDEFLTMFADEAKLAAQLNHPNIVHIFDLGKIEAGGYFIAMEYVEGRDLRSLLQSARDVGAPLPTPLAVYVASKIAAALDYAHRRRDSEGRELNIVHRDVSPPNILISYEGDIKLCDFGIAKAASKASQTQSGALKGKVQYMSPEQAWGRPLDRRSDIFSLGCVLYEMLTEQKLFGGDTDLSVLEKVRAAQVAPPSTMNPEVGKNLDAVVLKALAREPEDRYGNASDVLRDLEAVLYSYSPAPGSADLAIYLHRLQAEESAASESRARAAASPAPEEAEKKRKSKGAPVVRRGSTAPKIIVPPSSSHAPQAPAKEPVEAGVFGAFPPPTKMAAEKKSRTPLYAAIVVAALALGGVAWWMSRRPAAAPVAAPRPTVAPLAQPTAPAPSSSSAAPTAAPAMDPKAIEDEVQRQLATRRKEIQKALDAPKPAAVPSVLPAAAAAAAARKPEEQVTAPAPAPKEAAPEPAPVHTEPPPVREAAPEPTPAPVVRAPAPARDEVVRGDLVGPGPGVVEPELLSMPRVTYPPLARQQRLTGKVVVLVLVNEDGQIGEARLQQGLASRTGVNEAVVAAVKATRFRAATKNGIPVKMWRTVVIEVKP
jgi:TonB family protein